MVFNCGTYETEVSHDGGLNLSGLPLHTIRTEERHLSSILLDMIHGNPCA
jgi:hypothetical protein